MLLSVKRITPSKTNFGILLKDDKDVVFKNPVYTFHRVEVSTSEIKKIVYTPLDSDSLISITFDARYCYMNFIDEVPRRGTKYLYIVTRKITTNDTIDETESNTIEIESVPSDIVRFNLIGEETIYDTVTSIPTHITLGWDDLEHQDDNLDAKGIELYYSESPKSKDDWTPFEKLRGNSTGDNLGSITRIDLSKTQVTIHVPQLADATSPKDLRLRAVVVTETQQSNPSNEVVFSTHNMAGGLYLIENGILTITNGDEESTYLQIKNNELIDPYYTIQGEHCFEEDAFVWCERLTAYEEIGQRTKFSYRLGATKEIIAPLSVSYYLPYPSNYTFEVRSNNIPIASQYDIKTKNLSFMVDQPTYFDIIITNKEHRPGYREYEQAFKETTRRIISRLPTWFKMRRNPVGSVGAYFLDVIGAELSDIEDMLNYVSEQTHIATLDEDQLNQIYKLKLPENSSSHDRFALTGDGTVLERCDDLAHFLKPPYFLSEEEMIYHNNMFLIDYKEKLIYTRRNFEKTQDAEYGKVRLFIFRDNYEEPWYDEEIALEVHKLWNFYDEFGLLLDLKRLKDEDNNSFKERILDVFKNKSNSTKEGLLNGIARELGIRKNIMWSDTSKDLIIKDRMIVCNYIKLNGEVLPITKVWIDGEDNIVLKGDKSYPENVVVTYVTGIEMHTLVNKEDRAFQNQLFLPNGLATTLLLQYVSRIKNEIPIEWDSFKWNEGYWDANLPENGGIAFVPSIMDASISKFKNYEINGLQSNKK